MLPSTNASWNSDTTGSVMGVADRKAAKDGHQAAIALAQSGGTALKAGFAKR
jgi:hypothetical protein